jgi:hypothetical protein
MARFLKNPDLAPGSLAARLPITTSSLSDAPVTGLIRFNSTNNRIEFYYNGAWNQVAKIGTVPLVVDSFQGDGTNTDFTMTQVESEAKSIAVFIGGVYQQPNINYTVNSTTTITFTSAPPLYVGSSPVQVNVIHNLNSTNATA